ncbi:MAG: hypothetical protein E7242_06425 [Lachnospiraceae bacterium]|nr:hypothetical protein [Lachnospiraceae bacterium]
MKFNLKRDLGIAAVAAVAVVGLAVGMRSQKGTEDAVLAAGIAKFDLIGQVPDEVAMVTATLLGDKTDTVAASENAVSAYANMYMVITTEGEYVNVRAEASEDSEIVAKAYAFSGGTVLEKGDAWTKIQSGNAVGYINNAFLVFGDDVEYYATQRCLFNATVLDDELRLRREPNMNCETWGIAAEGDVFNVTAIRDDGWIEIDVNGYPGYLAAEYVSLGLNLSSAITIAEEEEAIRLEQERIAAEEAAARAEAESFENAIQAAIDDGTTSYILANSIYGVSDRDAYLLACLVSAEAGYETYDGKLAVANVIVTRYLGGSYGSSISDVIYSGGQFSVVSQGYFDRVVKNGPNSESIQAAADALAGIDNRGYTNFCSGGYYESHGVSASRGEIIGSQYFYNR